MTDGFIKTKCSSSSIPDPLAYKFVKFESYVRKNKIEASRLNTSKNEIDMKFQKQKPLLHLKKVAHEVIKFGISGFDAPKREEAKIALAVSLGAKPPHKEYINYKNLMEQKSKEKKEKKHMLNLIQTSEDSTKEFKKKTSRINSIKKQVAGSGNLLNAYGKVKKSLKRVDR